MQILGERHFVEIPGERTHELPPLLVRTTPGLNRIERVFAMAEQLVDDEQMIPPPPLDLGDTDDLLERHKLDLAIQLVEQYKGLVAHWRWGDSILDWIRQCETTFEQRGDLRPLLRPDLWPHAGRSSFVTLLRDKAVPTGGIELERAVGLRLSFRQPPPLSCCSDQFLLYLKQTVASSAYDAWSRMSPEPVSALPPERFHVEVVRMELT